MSLPRNAAALHRYQAVRQEAAGLPDSQQRAVELCIALWRMSDELLSAVESYFTQCGLSSTRATLLLLLHQGPAAGLTPAELAELSGSTRPTVTGVLSSLEAHNYIHRVHSPEDGRSYRVLILPHGRRVLTGLLPELFARLSRVPGTLRPDEQKELLGIVNRLISQIDVVRKPVRLT